MNIAIMQPTFNPWLGYFDLIESTDLFVFLDHVQLEKRSWQTRNKIKVSNQEFMITIPIKKEFSRDATTINNAMISNWQWAEKLLKTIESNYKKAKYYEEVFPFIKTIILENNNINLAKFNISIIQAICNKIGIDTKVIKSSVLDQIKAQKDELLFDICTSVKATEYISPPGSSNYLIESNAGERYAQSGISLYYQQYVHPSYQQVGKNFISYLGIFDLLFNEGFKHALLIITSGHRKQIYYKDFYANR